MRSPMQISRIARLVLAAMVCVLAWAGPRWRRRRDVSPERCSIRAARRSRARPSSSRTRRRVRNERPSPTPRDGTWSSTSSRRSTPSPSRCRISRRWSTPALPLVAAQEFALDLQLQPAGVTETVTVVGESPVIDMSSARIGVNVSEREVAGTAGQRPPDVAAAAAGARLAELRHGHLAGHPLLADARSSRTSSSTTASRARRSSTRRPATSTARTTRRSSCRRASRTSRSSASNRTAIRPSTAPAPAARSASSPSRAATASAAPSSSTCAATSWTRANYFDSQRNPDGSVVTELPKSKLKQNQFGGSIGGPLAEGSGVLLRQLRRLSPRRRPELRRSACRATPRGRAPCRPSPRCGPASSRRARSSCRARRRTPTSTSRSYQATQIVQRELVQRAASTSA